MIKGLYAITPDDADTQHLLRKVEAALEGGARTVQYRNKTLSAALQFHQAAEILKLCRTFSVPLIINDDIDLMLEIDADGLHLGKDDMSFTQARNRLGNKKLLGVSCYNQKELALAAQHAGADYIAFGSFFSSSTKPHAVRAPLSLISEAKQQLQIPIIAIGGITVDNAREVIRAGVDGVAVISALFEASDIKTTAKKFSGLFH